MLKGADYLRLAEFFMLTEDARKLPTRQRFVDLILDHFQIPSSAYNRISFESGWLPSYRLTPVHQLPDQIATLTHVRSLTARLFTRAEQAQNHCQIGNFGVAFRTIIDWMTSLGPIERLTDE